MGDAHAVDIEALAQKLREDLAAADALAARPSSGCPIIIAEVDAFTRNVDDVEYAPHHVSIGPYHHNSPNLARDDDKVRYLGVVLSASTTTLEAYLTELASIEGQARSCYARVLDMDSAKFVRMLLLDGCYLLVLFGGVVGAPRASGHAQGGSYHNGGAPLAGGDMTEDITVERDVVRDVFYLAENQVPFFVVDKIRKLAVPDSGVSAADAFAGYVQKLLRGQQYSVAPAVARPLEPGNLLHLLHLHLTPPVLPSPTTGSKANWKRRVGRWRTATEYQCAGVGFRTRPLDGKDARSILDVKLGCRGGTLEVPRLDIHAETWPLLRNLMALEQRNPAVGRHVTAYCVFMSQLACTARDVELLSKRGVISHGLGSHDEVAELFTDLCKGVVFGANDPDGNYLGATWQELEGRFRSRPRRWAAWLMLRYFRNPWLAVGLAAAAVGLLCSVLQAVFAVLSYRSAK